MMMMMMISCLLVLEFLLKRNKNETIAQEAQDKHKYGLNKNGVQNGNADMTKNATELAWLKISENFNKL